MTDIGLEQAMAAIEMVLRRTIMHGHPPPAFVVLVGGTALAAHGVRDQSKDVDFYAPEIDDGAVTETEQALRERFGPSFKIDATSVENLWGYILVRDISQSPSIGSLALPGGAVDIKALSLEDLFLLKLAAGRDKDRRDLPALAARVDAERMIRRFGQMARWHGNPPALPGLADEFVQQMSTLLGMDKTFVIENLTIPEHIKDMLREAHGLAGDDHGERSEPGSP